jgi:DNA-binding transcriptional MerR regulator
MKLKRSYSAREVAALTGLSARQLQWWDSRRLLSAAVASRRTPAGGFTERRYSPVDLYELLALANLRRSGFSVQKLRCLLTVLDQQFGVRLYDALGEGGTVTLLTDGREIYGKTVSGEFVNLLRAPTQPLLVVGGQGELKGVSARARSRRRKTSRKRRPAPSSSKTIAGPR